MKRRPWVIGHRGAAAVAPENTLASFERAFADGADGIELDVTISSDGVPVVIHDDTLARTAGVPGVVWGLTLRELRQYDVGEWFGREFAGEKIPLLAEVLDLARGRGIVNVEIKSRLWRTMRGQPDAPPLKDLVGAVARTLSVHASPEWIIVSSFDPRVLRRLKRRDPRWSTGFLRAHTQAAIGHVPLMAWADADFLHPDVALADRASRWAGGFERLLVWTVDSPTEQERLVAQGVRGIITNRPAETRRRLLTPSPPSLPSSAPSPA